ncbi:hypothetical protein BVX97_01795 [bacterium E08(2017)]|nr:hypothetical protein BVX97_01795 [bacterium E08(2017)]
MMSLGAHGLASLMLIVLFIGFSGAELLAIEDSDMVYKPEGKSRIHVDGCKRFGRATAEVKAKTPKMTWGEAKKQGLTFCSRCPAQKGVAPTTNSKSKGKSSGAVTRDETAIKKHAKSVRSRLQEPEKKYDPNTKAYCDVLWMRAHEENCEQLILKEYKKYIPLEQADKEGWRIGEYGQNGRKHCCFKGYRRKHPVAEPPEDILVRGVPGKRLHFDGCMRSGPTKDQPRMTLKEARAKGITICGHCVGRGPSLTYISEKHWKNIATNGESFTPPEGWEPKAFSPGAYPSKSEIDIYIKQSLQGNSGIMGVQFDNPVATVENFMTMRFFFPVGPWLKYYMDYRSTGDKRFLDKLLESARYYNKLSKEYTSACQLKASIPEGMSYMLSMAAWSRITLQLALKYPDSVKQSEIAEAEDILKTMIMVLKPTCEGDENLNTEFGIPQALVTIYQSVMYNKSSSGMGTLAMASAALEDLQKLKKTTKYQSTIDRYRKCVQGWYKNWKENGCLYTEADGKTYFYYAYAGTGQKRADGLMTGSADDVGHFGISMSGVALVHDSTPELGADDEFMTALANAIYHNSGTKNGSIQCPTADKIKPMSRHPHNPNPKTQFFWFEAFRDGLIEAQCQQVNASVKKNTLSSLNGRCTTLFGQYLKARRKDSTLVHLGKK